MSEKLTKATRFQYEQMNQMPEGEKPVFHVSAPAGWINDPNGFSVYKGKVHLFYQYHPYSICWGPMHWGHSVTDDMIKWKTEPVALAPDQEYDKRGCFSGSAVEKDGKHVLIYTGVSNVQMENGSIQERQNQCIAYGDGEIYVKSPQNPVITGDMLPADCSKIDFRDPKVWKHEDTYYMVCGASRNHKAQALLYRSKDMFHWEFFNVLAESRGEWGYMWECPDFYPLGDKYVLMFSPMGVGDRTVVYLVGDFDYQTGKFDYHVNGEIDWGFDYYAPQSFEAPDGRRIIVGWANAWDWMPFWKDWGPTYQEGWCGFYNIPREVRLMEDNTLQFIPVKEMELLRQEEWKQEQMSVGEERQAVKAGDGISYEWKFKVDLEQTDATALEIIMRSGEGKETVCTLDFAESKMSVDRNHSDGWSKGISESILYLQDKKELDIHIFSDQSSVEIFTDQYRNNHSLNIYAGNEQNETYVCARGGKVVIKDMETYGLGECYR